MENEDVILNQMEDTRTALTDKLETLESRVASSVEDATSNVAGTIEAVKETVEAVKDSALEAVATVKETVADTVTSAKEAVSDSVAALKSLVDVAGWVRTYPWPMMGLSAGIGFAFERLLVRSGEGRRVNWRGERLELPPDHVSGEAPIAEARNSRSWLMGLIGPLQPEINRLKGLAVGKVLGSVEQSVASALPADIAPQIHDILHGITRKLGGELLEERETAHTERTSTELA